MKAAIFWDLDDTLGRFDSLADWWPEIKSGKSLKHADPILVRHSMYQALEGLAQDGVINVLTTYATRDYATESLKRAKLAPFFGARIFHRRDLKYQTGDCKGYHTVIKTLGLEEQVEKGRVIVIGNSQYDRPKGHPIPFIFQDDNLAIPGTALANLVTQLSSSEDMREGIRQAVDGNTIITLEGITYHLEFVRGEPMQQTLSYRCSQGTVHAEPTKIPITTTEGSGLAGIIPSLLRKI